jgi:hypothetical protein
LGLVKKSVPKTPKHATSQPALDPVNLLARKMQVAAMMKQAFEGKKYQSGPSTPRDINGKRMAAGSNEATL